MTDRRDLRASDATLRRMLVMTCDWYGAKLEVVTNPGTKPHRLSSHNFRALQTAAYVMRSLTNASYERIGKLMHRHHSTVMYGEEATADVMLDKPTFRRSVEVLQRFIVDETQMWNASRPTALASAVEQEQKERATETV